MSEISINDEAINFLTRRALLKSKIEMLGNDDEGFNIRRDIGDLDAHIFMQLNQGVIRAYELERRLNKYVAARNQEAPK